MRRNLYNKKIEDFVQALRNEGWKEVTLHRDTVERHFRLGPYHLILKKHSQGHYCVIHRDKFVYGRCIHTKPETKSADLAFEYRQLIREYKRLRR